MIASLMMYLRPETADATARYWALIREGLIARGIPAPAELANDSSEFEVWRAPDLVLGQTCGMPYRLWLHRQVTLIGTPDFAVDGCPSGYYNSAIIVRKDDPRATPEAFDGACFAYNQTFSQSGYAAPYAALKPLSVWFDRRLQTHSHRAAAQAIASGAADIAALDAVSWRLIARYEPCAEQLRVLMHTEPTPGLPYIAGPTANAQTTFEAVREAINNLNETDRETLGIKGLVAIPKSAYLAIDNPPDTPTEIP
ncbi:ABC-type phosphate/phosphonate transport system, substrate-binding protein [Sulfitobacter brevis]|uniref:ABC-type phosphate/phosphonate transport system, substrate-binding protein n=2 Tax=Sulfitobacter brevis TaxID=74348 RepID=A0A1I1VTG4_9RHOB|nr:PhnD/SsuA/transferrin family substrate-binding protein [Sulfitobacter brevis]SFD84343.1 ABC-type phosphate/phosphonate transport system, substrate-binding protein [Sulfitobacter brevis]